MLKVNVGLSRKLSRDFNSTGFSLNLEGEICVGLDDPETMIEKVKEFYDLAEEALNQQIERYEGESAIGSRDERRSNGSNGHSNGRVAKEQPSTAASNSQNGNVHGPANGNGHAANGEAATNKQVQYLLNLGKRQGLTPPQLEGRIEGLLGKKIGVYDLTKREAGDVIDALSQNGAPATNGNGRNRISR
jgi:hypothetical protein